MSKVRALKSKRQVKTVTELLEKHYNKQFSQVWRFAVNVGLRIGDVLTIEMKDAKQALATNHLEIKEQKTGKINQLPCNVAAREVIQERLKLYPLDKWLFQSHHKNAAYKMQPISRQGVYDAWVEVGQMINVKMGTHSARKTRARILYDTGTPVAVLQTILNHSSERETLIYIDVTQDEKNQTFDDVIL